MWKSTALVNFDNVVATRAIAKVSQAALKNPGAAKQSVVTAIAAISLATSKAFWALKVAQANAAAGKPLANLAGSNTPIEFKLGRQGIHLISSGRLVTAKSVARALTLRSKPRSVPDSAASYRSTPKLRRASRKASRLTQAPSIDRVVNSGHLGQCRRTISQKIDRTVTKMGINRLFYMPDQAPLPSGKQWTFGTEQDSLRAMKELDSKRPHGNNHTVIVRG